MGRDRHKNSEHEHASSGPIEPTESLALSSPMAERDESTRIESPMARSRTGRGTGDRTSRTAADRRGPPPRKRAPTGGRRGDRPEERIGRVLGSYRLLEVLGKGGMGCVYRAEHIKLGREVALKLLRADYAERRDSVTRFFQEARAVNRIRHRNIVDVTDFVELDDGTTFIIMELLGGRSLARWAREEGAETPRALALLIQISDALAAAHREGIVHRDLKPDNIIVVPTRDGAEVAKVLDFGVAKLLHKDDGDYDGTITAAGSVVGTPAYMSPEQAGGLTVDARSDIYSVGAIMYELFTGKPVFRGSSFGEYVRKHLNEAPVPPRRTAGGKHIDDRLEATIQRCLEKRPDARYQSMEELRDALLHLLGAIETSVAPSEILPPPEPPPELFPPEVGAPTPPETAMALGDLPTTRIAPAPRRAARWPLALAGLSVVAAVAFAAVVLGAGDEDDAPAAPERRAASTPPAEPELSPSPTFTPIGEDDGDETVGTAAVSPGTAGRQVKVRFASTPSGAEIYAEPDTYLCKTPCDIALDADDGAKTFTLRKRRHVTANVTVDPADPPETVHRSLRALGYRTRPGRPSATTTAAPDPATVAPEATMDPDTEPPERERPPPTTGDGTPDPSNTLDPFGDGE